MVECSLSSLMRFVYNTTGERLEYPIVIFLFITLVFIAYVPTAKLIRYFSTMASRRCGINLSPVPLMDNHYDDLPISIQMENNGHTVVVRAAYSGNTPIFVDLYFRWSLLNSEGSEHMLNYRKLPLELQVMHRTGPGGDCTSSYGILMVTYFFDIKSSNLYLDPIIQNLHRIQRPGSKIEIPPFPLGYLCHQFPTGYYSYGDSLTEPHCFQGAEPLAISERQLNEFRNILSVDGKTKIVRNSRPVQNLKWST